MRQRLQFQKALQLLNCEHPHCPRLLHCNCSFFQQANDISNKGQRVQYHLELSSNRYNSHILCHSSVQPEWKIQYRSSESYKKRTEVRRFFKTNFPTAPQVNSTYNSMLHHLRFYMVLQILFPPALWTVNTAVCISIHTAANNLKHTLTALTEYGWRYVHIQVLAALH